MSDPRLVKADNGVYYVHWTEGRRSNRVSTKCELYANALDFLTAWLARGAVAATAKRNTVVELWPLYREQHVCAHCFDTGGMDSTFVRLERHFGALRPADITQDVVDAYRDKRYAGKIGMKACSGTVRKELSALMACLNWCADARRKLIAKAAVPVVTLPAPSPPRDRWLSISQLRALTEGAIVYRGGSRLSRVERFMWIALETASRKTAILELTWPQVDFEIGVIHFAGANTQHTKKRRVSVPISSALRPILERAYAERTGPLVLDTSRKIYDEVVHLGLQCGVGHVTPHMFRHTAATLMARRGVPLAHIADVLGNSVAMTEKTYRHHCPEATRRAVEMISGGALAVQPTEPTAPAE